MSSVTFDEWQKKYGPNGGAYDIEMQKAGWDGRQQEVDALSVENEWMRNEFCGVETRQFLSDVVTAAGLLCHGKTDKSLANRISEAAYKLLDSASSLG